MYNGKPSQKRKYRLTPWAVFALVLMLTLSVGGTVAYLFTTSDTVTNIFTPARVACEVVEGAFTPGVSTEKTDVRIKNTGNADAYIRAAIVITWQDAGGNVYGNVPAPGTDYQLTLNHSDWKEMNGYWYYTKEGNSGSQTTALIESCEALTSLDGYRLNVEILAQAIQAEPDAAVQQAWGVAASELAVIPAGGN